MSIGKGTIADFKGLTLDAKERRSTPYYVKVRIKALEPVPPAQLKTTDPANTLNAVGTSDVSPEYYQLPPGLFTPCNQVDVPKPFGSGQSYQSCRVYLMPAGGQQITMTWDSGSHERNQGSPYFTKPSSGPGTEVGAAQSGAPARNTCPPARAACAAAAVRPTLDSRPQPLTPRHCA
ncbi:MAG: hypothetical protein ABJB47_08290 [Actinomycetota bacterium]